MKIDDLKNLRVKNRRRSQKILKIFKKKYGYEYDFDYVRDKVDALFMIHKLREKKTHDSTFESIKKFYINLDRNQERREVMEREFKLYQMKNYERVSACDVLNIEDISKGNFGDTEYINQIIPRKINYRTKVELAITSSHLKTIRKGYLENLENIIVMEDDVRLTLMSHWKKSFEVILKELPQDCDILLLTHGNNFTEKKRKIFCEEIQRRDDEHYVTGAVCYLVTERGIKNVLDKFFENDKIFISEKISKNNYQIDTAMWDNLDVYFLKESLFILNDYNHPSHFFENEKDVKKEPVWKDLKILKKFI